MTAEAQNYQLSHRNVLIVGASSGIGYVIARNFARQGALVTVVAEVPAVHQAAEALSRESGSAVHAIQCDISDREDVIGAFRGVESIDVLVCNAGIATVTPVDDTSTATAKAVERTIAVNLLGSYWVTQAAVAKMGAGGRIIYTLSMWAHSAGPGFSAYVASKHALAGVIRTLAIELGPRGITVNGISPGSIDTELNRREMPEDMQRRLRSLMKIHNTSFIDPEQLAGAYLFVASDAASEITGQVIRVDRGATISW